MLSYEKIYINSFISKLAGAEIKQFSETLSDKDANNIYCKFVIGMTSEPMKEEGFVYTIKYKYNQYMEMRDCLNRIEEKN